MIRGRRVLEVVIWIIVLLYICIHMGIKFSHVITHKKSLSLSADSLLCIGFLKTKLRRYSRSHRSSDGLLLFLRYCDSEDLTWRNWCNDQGALR